MEMECQIYAGCCRGVRNRNICTFSFFRLKYILQGEMHLNKLWKLHVLVMDFMNWDTTSCFIADVTWIRYPPSLWHCVMASACDFPSLYTLKQVPLTFKSWYPVSEHCTFPKENWIENCEECIIVFSLDINKSWIYTSFYILILEHCFKVITRLRCMIYNNALKIEMKIKMKYHQFSVW